MNYLGDVPGLVQDAIELGFLPQVNKLHLISLIKCIQIFKCIEGISFPGCWQIQSYSSSSESFWFCPASGQWPGQIWTHIQSYSGTITFFYQCAYSLLDMQTKNPLHVTLHGRLWSNVTNPLHSTYTALDSFIH